MTSRLSPSEALAEQVVDRLIGAGLFQADNRDTLIAKLASGAMKGEDWSGEIDLPQSKAEQK